MEDIIEIDYCSPGPKVGDQIMIVKIKDGGYGKLKVGDVCKVLDIDIQEGVRWFLIVGKKDRSMWLPIDDIVKV